MKVSKHSWHYKMAVFGNCAGEDKQSEPPEDLCTYMRCVFIWAPFKTFMLAVLFPTLLFLLGAPIYAIFASSLPEGFIAIVVVGSVIWAMIIIFVLIFLQEEGYLPSFNKPEFLKVPEPIKQYTKAVKDKICPFIEYI